MGHHLSSVIAIKVTTGATVNTVIKAIVDVIVMADAKVIVEAKIDFINKAKE